jgi:hypothetical protein
MKRKKPKQYPGKICITWGNQEYCTVNRNVCYLTISNMGTLLGLQYRNDLTLVTDDQHVQEIKNYFGNDSVLKGFNGFLVKVGEGDYDEVYAFEGRTPSLWKTAWSVKRSCKR